MDKLRNTPDGDGSLLDHVMIIYGAGMADSNLHAPSGLPVMLVGGGAGTLRGGRHIRYPMDTPLANLHLALLDRLGISGWKRSATAAAGSNSSPCSWIPEGTSTPYPPVVLDFAHLAAYSPPTSTIRLNRFDRQAHSVSGA